MIIDIHGHYTTEPPALHAFRDKQLAGLADAARRPTSTDLGISDETLVKSVQPQVRFQSERGGTTIYQLNTNGDLVFYYAHLSRYADGLTEGSLVNQGQVIAYVGDTGNAGPGNYHLHFSIATVSDPKRYWEGTNINPYPLLHDRTR